MYPCLSNIIFQIVEINESHTQIQITVHHLRRLRMKHERKFSELWLSDINIDALQMAGVMLQNAAGILFLSISACTTRQLVNDIENESSTSYNRYGIESFHLFTLILSMPVS